MSRMFANKVILKHDRPTKRWSDVQSLVIFILVCVWSKVSWSWVVTIRRNNVCFWWCSREISWHMPSSPLLCAPVNSWLFLSWRVALAFNLILTIVVCVSFNELTLCHTWPKFLTNRNYERGTTTFFRVWLWERTKLIQPLVGKLMRISEWYPCSKCNFP